MRIPMKLSTNLTIAMLVAGAIGLVLPTVSCYRSPKDKLEDAGEHLGDAAKDTGSAIKDAAHDATH